MGPSMRGLDTPVIPRKLKWIWMGVLPSILYSLAFTTNAYANTYTDIDKYKLYIHNKVISEKEYVCITNLWSKENRLWDPYAKNRNSSAYGIPQLLKLKERNPYIQMNKGYEYIIHRYKSACNAWSFWLKNRYY
jgi:hypothetical protein